MPEKTDNAIVDKIILLSKKEEGLRQSFAGETVEHKHLHLTKYRKMDI